MSWLDSIANNIKKFGGALKAPVGAVIDTTVAIGSFDPTTLFMSDKDTQQVDDTFHRLADPVRDAITEPVMKTASAGLEFVNKEASTGLQMRRLAERQHYADTGDSYGWTGAPSVSEMWAQRKQASKLAETVSAGQSFWDTVNTASDPAWLSMPEKAVQAHRENDVAYNILSGTTDFLKSIYLDPLILAGKTASAVRAARSLRPVKAGEDVAAAVNTPSKAKNSLYQRAQSVIDKSHGWNAEQFRVGVDGLADATNGSAVASAFAKANRLDPGEREAEMRLIYRISAGDTSAVLEMSQKRSDLLDSLSKSRSDMINAIMAEKTKAIYTAGSGGNYLNSPALLAQTKMHLAKLKDLQELTQSRVKHLEYVENQTFGTTVGHTLRVTSKGAAKAAVTNMTPFQQGLIQHSLWNTPVRLFHSFTTTRPKGVINYDDPSSINELRNMFDRSPDLDPAIRNKLLSGYIEAENTSTKIQVVARSKAAIMAHEAKKLGFTPKQADGMLRDFMDAEASHNWWRGSRSASEKRFSAVVDPETGLANDTTVTHTAEDGVVNTVLPQLAPQLANEETMLNVDMLKHALKRNKNRLTGIADWIDDGNALTARHSTSEAVRKADAFRWGLGEAAVDLSNSMRKWWIFGVLTRVGYPIRVLIDDQMRIGARLGTAAVALQTEGAIKGLKSAGRGYVGLDRLRARADYGGDLLRMDELAAKNLKDPANAALAEEYKLLKGRTASVKGMSHKEFMQVYGPNRIGFAEGTLDVNGGTINDAFAGPDAQLNKALSSQKGLNDRLLHIGENQTYARHSAAGSGWTIVNPSDKGHQEAWYDAVNKQIRQDPMARQFLAGKDTAEVLHWLKRTPAGRAHAAEVGILHNSNTERWVSNVKAMVDQYVPTEWKQELLDKQISTGQMAEYVKAHPDELPAVHGPNLDYNLGRGAWSKHVNNAMSNIMYALGELPSDVVSRHPLYAAMYRQKAKQLADIIMSDPNRAKTGKLMDALDAEDRARIYKVSHAYALKEVKSTLYDISAHSNAATTLRFISPFMGAWEETLKRWWGLVESKPQILEYANLAYNMPNKIGTVVDQNGNPVNHSDEINDNEQLMLALPGWMGDHKFKLGGFVGYMYKNSFNLQLQGDPWWLPGFSPLVQIPVGAITNELPDVHDALQYIGAVPYGTPNGGLDLSSAEPATIRRLQSYFDEGKTKRDFAVDASQMYATMYADWVRGGEKGKWDENKQLEEAKRRTKKLYLMKAATSFLSPATVDYKSPYQFYNDAYSALKDRARAEHRTPEWVDDTFVKEYGETFFKYDKEAVLDYVKLSSAGKTNAYVDPTVAGVNAAKKYAKEISAFPALSGAITGPESEGAYNYGAAAYLASHTYQEGNPNTFKSYRSPREAADAAMAAKGWRQYTKFTQDLDALAVSRGETSARTDPELMAIKAAAKAKWFEENPAWRADYEQSDEGWFERNFEGMEKFANDSKVTAGRQDIPTLKQYVTLRKQVKDILAARKAAGGSDQPTANSNQDLLTVYSTIVNKMAESNTVFDQYWMIPLIDRDPLMKDITDVAQPAEETPNG